MVRKGRVIKTRWAEALCGVGELRLKKPKGEIGELEDCGTELGGGADD